MAERRIIVNTIETEYHGIFSLPGLYRMIHNWLTEKSYTKFDLKNCEHAGHHGRSVEYVTEPYKIVAEYATYVINIEIQCHGMKDIVFERGEKKERLNDGEIKVEITGILELDYEHRTHKKPLFYFFTSVIDQFLIRLKPEKLEAKLVDEVHELSNTIAAYLNLYKHEVGHKTHDSQHQKIPHKHEHNEHSGHEEHKAHH